MQNLSASSQGEFSSLLLAEPLTWPHTWTESVEPWKPGAKVKASLTTHCFPDVLPPIPPLPLSPTAAQYIWTLRGLGERRNKTLNNLFGETSSEEEQIMFR